MVVKLGTLRGEFYRLLIAGTLPARNYSAAVIPSDPKGRSD